MLAYYVGYRVLLAEGLRHEDYFNASSPGFILSVIKYCVLIPVLYTHLSFHPPEELSSTFSSTHFILATNTDVLVLEFFFFAGYQNFESSLISHAHRRLFPPFSKQNT